jgi:hypothetical protein
MKNLNKVILLGCVVMLLPACAVFQQKKVEKEMKQPINCATAEGDIRMLQHEKAHVAQQIVEGVTAIVPASLVLGIVSGTEGTKIKVATGEYNKAIDKRIAEIKSQCGVK